MKICSASNFSLLSHCICCIYFASLSFKFFSISNLKLACYCFKYLMLQTFCLSLLHPAFHQTSFISSFSYFPIFNLNLTSLSTHADLGMSSNNLNKSLCQYSYCIVIICLTVYHAIENLLNTEPHTLLISMSSIEPGFY